MDNEDKSIHTAAGGHTGSLLPPAVLMLNVVGVHRLAAPREAEKVWTQGQGAEPLRGAKLAVDGVSFSSFFTALSTVTLGFTLFLFCFNAALGLAVVGGGGRPHWVAVRRRHVCLETVFV